jgi:DNA-binding transcriptional LysR family regulator
VATRNPDVGEKQASDATLRQAMALVLVASTGSYHEACSELGLKDATAVYHRIERLGKSLGLGPLVTQAVRGRVRLTPDGEQVLVHAQALVDAYHSLRGSGHCLRVCCYPILAARSAETVLAFATDPKRQPIDVVYHDVSDSLRHDGGAGIVTRTAAGEIDVGIAPSDRRGKGLVAKPLYEWRLRVIVHEDDPLHRVNAVSINDLHGRRLLVSPKGHRSRELYENAAARAQTPGRIAMQLADQHAAETIARAGEVYTGVLPDDAFGPPNAALGPLLLGDDGESIGDSYSIFYAARHEEAAESGARRSQAVLDLVTAIQTALADDLPDELAALARAAEEVGGVGGPQDEAVG